MTIKKIKLNFLESFVMFYDWLETDDIKEYNNVSVYRVNSLTISDLINYNLKIIKNDFICEKKPIIISDSYSSLALLSKGNTIKKSSILLDDELKINDEVMELKLTKIDYIKDNQSNENKDLRKVKNIKNTIINELQKIENEQDFAKLNYYYYELFNKKGTNFKLMLKSIYEQINGEIGEKEIYLYNLIQCCYKLV